MQYIFKKEVFAKEVRIYRLITKDIDLREAAEKIGISAATLSRCENKKAVELTTFLKICFWMKVSPMKFLKKGNK